MAVARRPNAAADWPFPFPAPGKPRAAAPRRRPAGDGAPLAVPAARRRRRSRAAASRPRSPSTTFKSRCRDLDRRRRRHLDRRSRDRPRAGRGPLRLSARPLARLPDRRGEQGRDAVALPADAPTTSSTRARSALSRWDHRTVKLLNAPRRRGPHHDDRLAAGGEPALGRQDLAAQPQARGAGGGPRRHRHQPQLPAPRASAPTASSTPSSPTSSGRRTTRPSTGTPASPATSAWRRARPRPSAPDGTFDFFACYNHTYRDSIPGFLDLVGDLAERSPREFRKRWADNEIAALWQALSFQRRVPLLQLRRDLPGRDRGGLPWRSPGPRGSISTRR